MSKLKSKLDNAEVERKRRRVQFHPVGESKTQQQFKASVDVNNIVRHYAQTGIDPYESRKQQKRFGNVPNQSYTEAMFHVAEVQSAFHTLPAQDRAAFQNDPQRWIDHLQYTAQAQESIVDPEPSESVSRDHVAESDPPSPTRAEDLNIT